MTIPKYIIATSVLFTALTLGSCQDKEKQLASNDINKQENENLYGFHGKKLDPEYITSKRSSLEKFYEKNWPNNSMNGGFLVAKNGEIIFQF